MSGSPGAGKTALAVHAAHQLGERFPDGHLYVDLHGATAGLQPLAPLEVLGRFLRALGTDPGAIPTDVEEASAAFRSRVAGRRLLVVLDNAADATQVAPLLPAAAGCGVLVTSRRILSAVAGARHLHLDVLAPEEAVELLSRLAGEHRVAAEPEAAAEVARLCGRLPLALRIAGARLAARRGWPVTALAERLTGQQSRLDELQVPEVGVRASFQVSYQQLRDSADALDRAAAEAFGLLRPGDYRLAGADDRWRAAGLEFAGEQAALGWLEAERPNLLAAVRQAVATPGVPVELGIQLVNALFGFFWVRSHRGDLVQANQIILELARREGDLATQAQAHNDLGAG